MRVPGELPTPDRAEISIEAVLHALADPVRLRIVRELAVSPEGLTCGSLDVTVSRSTLTHHLRTLREAGVTRTYSEGTFRRTVLRRECLDARFPGLLDGVLAGAARL